MTTSLFSLSRWDKRLFKGINNSNYKLVRKALREGANVNARSRYGTSALLVAIKEARNKDGYKIVRTLVYRGANINFYFKKYNTSPLSLSIIKQRKKVFDLLLRKKVNVNQKDRNGFTAITLAVQQKTDYYTKALIRKGAKVNVIAKNVSTLFIASQHSGYYTIAALVRAGADVNFVAKTENEATPLMNLAYRGDYRSIKLLIKKGAQVNTVASDGNTAYSLAGKRSHKKIMRYLLKYGAKKVKFSKSKQKTKKRQQTSKKNFVVYTVSKTMISRLPFQVNEKTMNRFIKRKAYNQKEFNELKLKNMGQFSGPFKYIPITRFRLTKKFHSILILKYNLNESTAYIVNYEKTSGRAEDGIKVYYSNSEGSVWTKSLIKRNKILIESGSDYKNNSIPQKVNVTIKSSGKFYKRIMNNDSGLKKLNRQNRITGYKSYNSVPQFVKGFLREIKNRNWYNVLYHFDPTFIKETRKYSSKITDKKLLELFFTTKLENIRKVKLMSKLVRHDEHEGVSIPVPFKFKVYKKRGKTYIITGYVDVKGDPSKWKFSMKGDNN